MRKVLRSLFWNSAAEKPDVEKNFEIIRVSTLTNIRPEEKNILEYCLDFFLRSAEAPSLRLVYDNFVQANGADELVLLDTIQNDTPYFASEFQEVFVKEIADQAAAKIVQELRAASDIATKQGADEAFNYVYTHIKTAPKLDEDSTPVNLRGAKDALIELYEDRENSVHRVGMKTGYGFFDDSTGGLMKGHLHILAGFNGHLKSTMMLNIIVNNAVDYGWNNILFTTEMATADVELMIAAIHSGHPSFRTKFGSDRVDAFAMLRGNLDQVEKDILIDAIDDLTTNPKYGSIRVIDTSSFTSFSEVLARVRQEHLKEPVDVLWLDYITRLPTDPAHVKLGMNATASRNEMILEAKRFAMQFDGGNGIAFCTPFQTNREGFKQALKNEGKMDLSHLFQYNNAEKEGDLITTIWYGDQERDISIPKIGFLKNRFGPAPHDLCDVFIDDKTRRIYPLVRGTAGTAQHPRTGEILGTHGTSNNTPEEDVTDKPKDDDSSNV